MTSIKAKSFANNIIYKRTSTIYHILRTYNPKKWNGMKKSYQKKVANLFLNALVEQKEPYMLIATVWFEKNRTISEMMEYIRKWVVRNPIKNGTRTTKAGAVQKWQKRPRVLFMWCMEEKDTSAPDCIHESGAHAHVLLLIDAHSYKRKTWAYHMMSELQSAGIIAQHTSESKTAWFISGGHNISENDVFEDALKHALYLSKNDQKNGKIRRRNLGSNLGLTDYFSNANGDKNA